MKSKQIKSSNIYPKAVNNKSVEAKEYNDLQGDVDKIYPSVINYITSVPFNGTFVITKTLNSNDAFTPDTYDAVPGCGAIYRLIGDGSHSPTFSGFNKSSSSGDYVNTLGTVNLITFLYDGVEYWYNIVQPAV